MDSVEYIAVRTPSGQVALSVLRGGIHQEWNLLPSSKDATIGWGPFIQSPASGMMNIFAPGRSNASGCFSQHIVDLSRDTGLELSETQVVLGESEQYASSLASGSLSGGRMGVWGVTPDSQLVGKTWEPLKNAWTPTGSSSLKTAHAPWATQVTPTTLNLYATALDGTIKQNYYNGSTWSGWLANPTPMFVVSGPSSSVLGEGRHVLFSQTRDSTLQALVWDGAKWGNMSLSSFKVLSGPTSQPIWNAEVVVYALALDSQIVRIRWSEAKGWIGLESLGPIPGAGPEVSVQRRPSALPALARNGRVELPSNLADRSGRLDVMDAQGRTLGSAIKVAGQTAVALVVPGSGALWYRFGELRGRILTVR